MDFFNRNEAGELFAEAVPVSDIVTQYGSPCYIYSKKTLTRHWRAFDAALGKHPHLICYAVKANSNIAILQLLANLGSGFDIVSIGELERVLKAGGSPSKIVYSGIVKQPHEIERALEVGVHCFNIESEPEMHRIQAIAKHHNIQAAIALRINPNIDGNTHPYISTGLKENKFGIPYDNALTLYRLASNASHLQPIGIDCHIGSQILTLNPFIEALEKLLNLVATLENEKINISHIDLGGGLGVSYTSQQTPPNPSEYVQAILQTLLPRNLSLILEPGRAIAANAGILVTQVHHIKHTADKNFLLIDAAMNDLIRPALYDAHHRIEPIQPDPSAHEALYDIVGPVCETSDFLAKNYPLSIRENQYLAVFGAGAYGFSMSSNYNSRPRPPEILVDHDTVYEIRKRETLASLYQDECLL